MSTDRRFDCNNYYTLLIEVKSIKIREGIPKTVELLDLIFIVS